LAIQASDHRGIVADGQILRDLPLDDPVFGDGLIRGMVVHYQIVPVEHDHELIARLDRSKASFSRRPQRQKSWVHFTDIDFDLIPGDRLHRSNDSTVSLEELTLAFLDVVPPGVHNAILLIVDDWLLR